MENIQLRWAIYYRSLGFPIFPVQDKTPLIKWKIYQENLPDEAQIKEWWTSFPNADIGCSTGPFIKRLVLDIDGPEGKESVHNLHIPITQTVRTRRGVQYHFAWDEALTGIKTTIAGLMPGVDVRGTGGYVKLPPSKCSDGTFYQWMPNRGMNEVKLEYPPEWLVRKLVEYNNPVKTIGEITTGEHWITDVIDGVDLGARHEALKSLAGYYFNCMHPDVALQHLRDWNKKNKPPYPDQELELQLQDFSARFKKGEYSSNFLERKLNEPKDFKLLTATEVVQKYSSRIDFLVEGLIPSATSTIFAGWQGRGKTYCATDLVIEIARKRGQGKWLGTFDVKHGPVIYIDNEIGGNLTSFRLSQLLPPKGLTPADLNLHYSIRNRVKLTDERDYQKIEKELSIVKPVLLVVDSFATCHTLEENSPKDMRHFFDDLIAPLCEKYHCAIMFIDHEGKGVAGIHMSGSKRVRGSGGKGDAVDQMISLDEQDGMVIFEHSKPRYTKRHKPFIIEITDAPGGIIVKNCGYLE